MKIYLFEHDTGFYVGEDFSDEPVKPGSVRPLTDATTVPPPGFERGQLPVFNRDEQRWEIHDISALHAKVSKDGPKVDNRGIFNERL